MSDYTPTTEEIAEWYAHKGGSTMAPYYASKLTKRVNEFDRWLAAHDAEVRAAALAEQGETEWEYAWEADEAVRTTTRPRGPRILFDGMVYPPETLALFARGRRIRRRKAGPWIAVEGEAG